MASPLQLEQLQTKTIPTARESIYYAVPFHPEGVTFDVITAEYLRQRVEYSFGRFTERLEMTTAKHLSDRREPVAESLGEFRKRLLSIIDNLPPTGITSRNQLAEYCQHTQYALYLFKSDRQRYLNTMLQLAEVFYKIEQQVISTLFDLPAVSSTPPTENLADIKEIRRIKGELDFLLPAKKQFLKQLESIPTKEEITESINLILENFEKIQKLLSVFPTESDTETLPEEVKEAIIRSLRKYQAAIEKFTEQYNTLINLRLSIDYPLDFLNKTEGAKEYFTGLVKFKKQVELSADLAQLEANLIALNGFKDNLQKAQKQIEEQIALMGVLLEDSCIKNTLQNLTSFNPARFQFSEDSIALFKLFQTSASDVTDSEDTSGGLAQTTATESTTMEEGPEPIVNLEITGKFQWKKASEEERNAEAVRRLIHHPRLTIINWLYHHERWEDLGKLFSFLGYNDIGETKLGGAVGTGASYVDLEDLFTHAFPKSIPLGNFEKIKIRTDEGEKRFRWVGKNVPKEAIRQEIRGRLFKFWPLLEDLEKAGRRGLMLQVLGLMQRITFTHAGLNESCIGNGQSVYPNIQAMLADVFEETPESSTT